MENAQDQTAEKCPHLETCQHAGDDCTAAGAESREASCFEVAPETDSGTEEAEQTSDSGESPSEGAEHEGPKPYVTRDPDRVSSLFTRALPVPVPAEEALRVQERVRRGEVVDTGAGETPLQPKPLKLVCPACGTRHMRHAAWTRGDCCSRGCYLSLPFPLHPNIRREDLVRVAQQYPSQIAAAKALGISYPQYRRVLKKEKINGSTGNEKVLSLRG